MLGLLLKRVLYALLPVGVVMSGCASTSPQTVDVRPIEIGDDRGMIDLAAVRENAQLYYTEGAFISAYTEYKTLVLHMPKDKDYTALLGFADAALALSALGETYQSEARMVYELLNSNQDVSQELKTQAQTGLTLLDIMGGEIACAESDLMMALDQNPDDPRLWNALGLAYDRKNNWVSAVDSYVTALRLSHKRGGTISAVQNNMGMSLLMQGRTQEALDKFTQAHTANPDVQLYDNNYRLALILSGDLHKAIQGLEEGPLSQLYNDAGFISAQRGDVARARSLYEKAIAQSPVYFDIAYKNLASLN